MVSNSNEQHALNQRSPAEGKGKGQKLLAQGSALGIMAISNAPCKGNSFILPGVLKLLPLQGDRLPPQTTQGVALGYELLPLQGVLGTELSLTAYHKRRASAPSGRVGDRVISKNRLSKDMYGQQLQ